MYVADAHCDFLYYMLHREYDVAVPRAGQAVDIPGMRAGGAAMQLFAAWMDPDEDVTFLQQCMSLIDAYKRMLAANSMLTPLTKDFEPGQGKIAAVLTIEGGEAIEERLENLRLFHELGVKAMTLTWNDQNELASPAMARRDKGLSRLGRSVVREMERINMAVDVAHLSDASIDGVLDEISAPIFSSHTNARAVLKHRRSLSDRHIREIARRGGVVGVNYYSPQLVERGRARIEDIVKHIEHIAAVGGIDCVALGSDFDGMPRSSSGRLSRRTEQLEGCSQAYRSIAKSRLWRKRYPQNSLRQSFELYEAVRLGLYSGFVHYARYFVSRKRAAYYRYAFMLRPLCAEHIRGDAVRPYYARH